MPGDILNSTGTTEGILQLEHNRRWMNRPNVTSWQTAVIPCKPVHPVCVAARGRFRSGVLRNTFRLTDEEIAASLTRGQRITWRGTGRSMTFPSLFHISRFGFAL